MKRQTASEAAHLLLLEGLLRRLSRSSNAHRLVLRGGMLMRIWIHPLPRQVGDLDLAATFPFDVDVAAAQLRELLTTENIDDGVVFDPRRVRIQSIWQNSESPGVRMYSVGEAGGERETFSVDVTFGEELVPPPELRDYPLADGHVIRVWMCRPETILGRKLHALWRMGIQHWRPKDLNDVRLILDRIPTNPSDLASAIAASFVSRGDPADGARSLFSNESWWTTRTAAARWSDYESTSEVTLDEVVAAVKMQLAPILERLL